MLKLPQNINLQQAVLDVPLASFDTSLFDSFQSYLVLCEFVFAAMDSCKVAASKKFTDGILCLDVEHNASIFESVNPLVNDERIIAIKLQALALSHKNKPIELHLLVILNMGSLQPSKFDIQDFNVMVFIIRIGRIRCLYEIIVMSKDIVFLLEIGS